MQNEAEKEKTKSKLTRQELVNKDLVERRRKEDEERAERNAKKRVKFTEVIPGTDGPSEKTV